MLLRRVFLTYSDGVAVGAVIGDGDGQPSESDFNFL